MDRTEPSPPSAKKRFWHRPAPYVVAGILLGLALVPVVALYVEVHRPNRIGLYFRPESPERYPDRQVVDLSKETASRLPGDIPGALENAKTLGSGSTAIDPKDLDEVLRAFGINPDGPGWHYTLLRYEGAVYAFSLGE
jgi:hypothetical protein